ncbi:MAG: sigma-70 family RNA polymerase sigma factor [Candidatus Wildermuthbacteria bacterium]|nr:sigma-70 family RNA polymerase sigma factor [Candidatus Wildermuthbacteria bacterium]
MEEVYRVARKESRRIHDSYREDIVQETALALFLHGGVPNGGYVMRTTRNKHVDYLRREGRISLVDLEGFMVSCYRPVEDEFLEREEREEIQRRVQRVLSRLSPAYRQVLEYIGDEMSYQQIANNLGVSIGTIRSRLHLAKRRFRKVAQELELFN